MAVQVSRSIVIHARPEEVFDFVARPANHPRMDGSGSVKTMLRGPDRLRGEGDRFGMRMRIIVPYVIRNTVTEFEENRRLAWRHFTRHTWRYELEPVEGGTRVTETFDPATSPLPLLYYRLFGYPDGYATSLERTLENLKDLLEA